MTTAARPTWAPARGGQEQGGTRMFAPSQKFSSRDLAAHTNLKTRSAYPVLDFFLSFFLFYLILLPFVVFHLCCLLFFLPISSISGSSHLVSLVFLSSAIWFLWSIVFLSYAFCLPDFLLFPCYLLPSMNTWDRLFVSISWGFFSLCAISWCRIFASAFICFYWSCFKLGFFVFSWYFLVPGFFVLIYCLVLPVESVDVVYSQTNARLFPSPLSKLALFLFWSIALSSIRSLGCLKLLSVVKFRSFGVTVSFYILIYSFCNFFPCVFLYWFWIRISFFVCESIERLPASM